MSQQRPSRPDLLAELVGSSWGGEATARAIPRAAPSEPRPALRAKGVPRSLNPTRARARSTGATALNNACRTRGVSSARLAAAIGLTHGSDKEGDEARSGAIPVTLGETVLLLPLDVVLDTIAELLMHRIAAAPFGDGERSAEALFHVEALRHILPLTPR